MGETTSTSTFTLTVQSEPGVLAEALGLHSQLESGQTLEATPGMEIRVQQVSTRVGFIGPIEVGQLAVSFTVGVAGSYVASWLYEKLHGKARRISINEREIELQQGEIQRIIERTIKQDE